MTTFRGVGSLRMPLRFLRGHSGRLALTIAAIATGVLLVCQACLVSPAVVRAFADVVDTTVGSAALQVRRCDGGSFPKDVANQVVRVGGVVQTVPVLTATAFTSDASGELLAVHGYDLADNAAARVYGAHAGTRTVLWGPALLPGSVILTKTFAERHHVLIGNRINLDTPSGRQTFTVVGLVEASGLARLYGGNVVIMDLFAAQRAFARPGEINRVDVVLKPGIDSEQIAERLRAVLPPEMQVESSTDQKRALERATQAIQQVLTVFSVGGLLAAFFIAFNSLSTLCEARMWEFAVLRAIGARQAVVWRQLVLTAAILGLLGVAVGIPMGLVYAQALLPTITQAAATITNTVLPTAQLSVGWTSLLLAAVLGVATAVAAVALPAWRAARVEVAEALRSRGVEQREPAVGFTWLARTLVTGTALAVLGLELVYKSGPWGIIAGSLVVLGTGLAARPLTGFLGTALARGLGRFAVPSTRLAVAQFVQRPRRAALMVATVGLGVGSVLWLWMVARSFEQSVIDALTQSYRADLVITSAHLRSAFLEAPVSEELVSQLGNISGVRAVVGVRNVEVQYEGGTIMLEVKDPAYFRDPAFGQLPLNEQLPDAEESVARGEAVVASSDFLENFRARVGDTVMLSTPSGPLRLPIVGVTNQPYSPRGLLNLSRDLYGRMWRDNQIDEAHVLLANGADRSTVHAAIAAALGRRYNLRILSGPELVEYLASRVRAGFAFVYICAGVALVVVFVGIAETLLAEVISRRRELGALRVVGARRGDLGRMVLVGAAVLAVMGLLLACLSGLAQGALWVQTIFPFLFGFVLALHIPYQAGAVFALLTLAVCVVAALLPAWRAARLQPTVAVRDE